jgi:hypothetical protein
MKVQTTKRALWRQSLRQPCVWSRAATWGIAAGLVQAMINQGDRWAAHSVDGAVMLKTILSPLISFVLVLVSSAVTWVQRTMEQDNL